LPKEGNLSNLVVIGASRVEPLKFADELSLAGRCRIVVHGTAARLACATTSAQGIGGLGLSVTVQNHDL
jgi:hypothetical protein